MFNLICVLIVACLGSLGLLIPVYEVNITGGIILGISGVWLLASFINNLFCYNNMFENFEGIRASLKNLEIYKEKQATLISEFRVYLADKYPDLEKEIFKMIIESKNDINVILNYPEIKSSKTLIELVKQINSQADKVYEFKIILEHEYAIVRFYNANKWFYIKAQTPEDIKKLL